jgi:hypothetical protein
MALKDERPSIVTGAKFSNENSASDAQLHVLELHQRPHAVSASRWGGGNASVEAERRAEAWAVQKVRSRSDFVNI